MEEITRAAQEMNDEAAKEQETHAEEQSTALEKVERAEITLSGIETHSTGIALAEKYLPAERVKDIAAELSRIDQIEQTETVEMRRELGTLPKEFARTEYALVSQGINPAHLTIEEAADVLKYTRNASEDIIKKKTEIIAGAITRIGNGVRHRRDFSYDPEKQRRFERLSEKLERFERGEIDIECGFDRAYYLTEEEALGEINDDHSFDDARDLAVGEGYGRSNYSNDAYSRFFRDMGVRGRNERYFDELSVDELLEENIISEDDLFIYGPFTRRDIAEDFEVFKMSTWIDATNFRDKGTVGVILEETVPPRTNETELDLTREYIASEILPNRRPGIKNMISLVASVGIEYAEAEEEKRIVSTIGGENATELRDQLSWASYYAAKIIGMRPSELKSEYGATRPVTREFYEELLKRSEAITEKSEQWLAKNEGPYATKLDSRLFAAESLFEPVVLASEEDDGSDFEGLALPGEVLPGAGLGAAAQTLMETESTGA